MNKVEDMRAFIIKFAYILIWGGIIFVILKYLLPLFMPFVIAFLIAYLLKPLIRLIVRKTPLPRKPVAIVLLILSYLVVGTLATFLVIRMAVYLGDWFSRLPSFYRSTVEPAVANFSANFDGFIDRLDPSVKVYLENASESISKAVSGIVSGVSSGAIGLLTNFASHIPWIVASIVLTIIASFFMVVDYDKVTAFIAKQLSPKLHARVHVVHGFVTNTLFRFGKAYLIIISITFAEVCLGLLVLGVPSAILIALAIALVDILPVLGTGTIMIPWAIISLGNGNLFLGIGLLVLYAIITVVRQIIEPRIVGGQIGLYPLLTLICMFIGAKLFGFWGMFGFPIALTVIIYLNREGEIALFKE